MREQVGTDEILVLVSGKDRPSRARTTVLRSSASATTSAPTRTSTATRCLTSPAFQAADPSGRARIVRSVATLTTQEHRQAVAATAPWLFSSASVVSTALTGFGLLKLADLGDGSKAAIGVAAMVLAISLTLAALSTLRNPDSWMMELAVILFTAALLLAGSLPLVWAFA